MKKLKRILSMVLVVCMIFTSQAFVTFAEGMENTEAIVKETRMGELSEPEKEIDLVGASEDNVGAKLGEPEEETIVGASDLVGESDIVGANYASANDDARMDELSESEETEYAEEPEEDEIETETRMGEPEDTVGASSASATEETAAEETTVGESEETVGASSASAETETEPTESEEGSHSSPVQGEKELEKNEANTETKLFGDITLSDIYVESYTITDYYVGKCYDPSGLVIVANYSDDSHQRITYIDNEDKFTFSPDYVSNPFTEVTDEENPAEMTITYTESRGSADVTTAIRVGDPPAPKNFYVLYYASDADYSTGTLSEQHIPASASTDQLDYLTGDFFDSLRNLSPVQPWGFYKIGDGSTEFDIDDAKSAYDWTTYPADFIYNRSYLAEEGYKTWNDAGAANDIYYGVLYEVRPYMYWINGYDEEDVPTIYYYATEESGGTPVIIGTDGVEYNGLDSLVKQSIKKAVFVNDIVATDVRSYFAGFSGLESITNLGKLDTTNATSFEKMFDNCSSIEELDVSGLETDSLTDTSYMFNDCRNVTTITLGDNFDTSKVTNMKQMFSTCNALESIDFGSKFDTSNVTNMNNMFCAIGAETLDLTKFDTGKVTNMEGMFAQSLQLKTINVSDKFKVDQVTDGDYMFVDCSNLVGEQGTKYTDTSNPWGVAYAHIDEGPSNPGLFSGAQPRQQLIGIGI